MKKISFIFSLFLSFVFAFSLSGVTQTPQTTSPKNDEDDVVKISTELVQVDAVITDKQGNQVTNLTATDIELLQDGKPQTITNFSYISREMQKHTQMPAVGKTDKNNLPAPPVSFRLTGAGRVLTFVIDDGNCNVTNVGMKATREGLEKFVNEQMENNDLVAIYQTRRGSGLLQQYSSDKGQLLNIIHKIRWYPPDGICSTTGDAYEAARSEGTLKDPSAIDKIKAEKDRERRESIDNYNKDKQTVGTIGVLRYVINGLQHIGGRKILFLFSDGLPISNGKNSFLNSYYDVRDLTELANRASVVINPIDLRGLDDVLTQASDNPKVGKDDAEFLANDALFQSRQMSDDSRQSGLAYTANETGGKFYKNSNFLDYPIREILKSEIGYYLIGYQPEAETFKGKKFHKIEIKSTRPGLIVSSRSGFSGLSNRELRLKPHSGDSELYEALISPLPNADLKIRLSAYFSNTTTEGNFIRALLYIDGKDITFTDNGNGTKKAVFDIVAVTLNEKDQVIDDFNRTHTINFPAFGAEEIKRNGLIYTADVPVKKEGTYTFRAAVRENATKRLGSSSQIIEIPDLKKGKLLISGLIMSQIDATGKITAPVGAKAEAAFSAVTTTAVPAIRRFHRNTILGYAYTIYNAKNNKSNNQPKLTIQTNLYQAGNLISENAAQPAQLEKQADWSRISDFGYLKLPSTIQTGDYALQIIVKDLQTNQTTSQWIDFEIVK